ncbi:MAG: ABC-2 family transporter protein [Phycisphaerae bacterium]|nr:ABC-2 family transporter protein [Phycisphaerae bacterium]
MNAARLYIRYIGISIRSQMQYRASFVMLSISSFFATAIDVVGIWALFERFGTLRGWRLAEVGLFFGLVNVAMAIGDAFGRGFDQFYRKVRDGGFDRLLLRPRSTALQVAAQELTLFRIGKLTQGLIVLFWAAGVLNVTWTAGTILLALFAIFGGATLFYGLWVLQATLCFWTVESLEIMNAFTYGGAETAEFPLSIYRPWFRRFFTFVVPLACVSYFPALAILGKEDSALGSSRGFQQAAPGIGVVFMLISLQVWKIGVRHYRSTGS